MADNVAITPGVGVSVAADDIAGVLWQRIKVGWGADGVAGDASFANPLPVSNAPSLRYLDASGNIVTPKYAFANIAASTTDSAIVAAVATKRIVVLSYRVMCGATATTFVFRTKPAGAGTDISDLMQCAPNGGAAERDSLGLFWTVAGEGLSGSTGAGSQVGVRVTYAEV